VTSLSGEFHTDLTLPDALTACAEAIHGLGWPIESVERDRVISHAGSPAENPPTVEVLLAELDDGTEIRITGSDTEANPLEEAELIAVLSRARDAIETSVEDTDVSSERSAPAGWFDDPQEGVGQRYWDGSEWTNRTRDATQESENGSADNTPKQESWWRDHWRGPVIAGVAFLVGAAIGTAGGNSSTTRTVGRTTTATIAGPVTTQTQTQVSTKTQTVEAPSTASTSAVTPTTSTSTSSCDPNYSGACLDPTASDYDCEGGSGDGPLYTGEVKVVGDDHFDLDSNGNGIGCE
jgi:hypothetical protein